MRIRHVAELFAVQFINYFLLTFNYRSIAQVRYTATFVTDVCISALTFLSIQRVARATTRWEQVGYVIGGSVGALCALWISTFVFGK